MSHVQVSDVVWNASRSARHVSFTHTHLLGSMAQYPSQSPPPLRHPVPTHPAYIPEPPSTPGSPQGYQRFSSSPSPNLGPPPHLQHGYPSQQPQHVPAYITTPFQHSQPPHGHIQQHQQGPYQPQPTVAHAHQPDFTAWGIDGATAQLGMQLGHSAVAAGQDYVQRNVRPSQSSNADCSLTLLVVWNCLPGGHTSETPL